MWSISMDVSVVNWHDFMCKLTGFHSYLSIFKLGELLRPLNPLLFFFFINFDTQKSICSMLCGQK